MKFVHCVLYAVSILLVGSATGQNNPVPFLNQPLAPDAAAPGGSDFTLAVNGTGFVPGATVNWNGSPLATTFVNQSKIIATVPAADIVAAGTAKVTVTNPVPGGGTSNIEYFSVANSTATVVLTEIDFTTGLVDTGFLGPVTGDFNNDGILDLALTTDSGICLFLGVGDGSFQSRKCTQTDGGVFVLLHAADFNADGNLDSHGPRRLQVAVEKFCLAMATELSNPERSSAAPAATDRWDWRRPTSMVTAYLTWLRRPNFSIN